MTRERKDRESIYLVLDVVMLILITANIALLLFEWIFLSEGVQRLLADTVPTFYTFYNENIHEHFFWIDLCFIAVFVVELLVQWVVAVVNRRYHRWFFYPFLHWYDVLGCIPVGSFRALRLLRVFSLTVKMQRLGVVDLRKTYVYGRFSRYRDILTEELSDRVAVNLIEGMQQEVEQGSPVVHKIRTDVLEPQREALVASLSQRMQQATAETYTIYREDIRQYVDQLIADAIDQNSEIRTIEQIPMLGRTVSMLLERAISDIVFNVINEAVEDLAAAENNPVINQVTRITADALLEVEDETVNRAMRELVLHTLELVKEQVAIQQWKRTEMEPDETEKEVRREMVEAGPDVLDNH